MCHTTQATLTTEPREDRVPYSCSRRLPQLPLLSLRLGSYQIAPASAVVKCTRLSLALS